MAGYSKRSLVDKLGSKGGFRVALVDAPKGYNAFLGPLPKDVRVVAGTDGELNFIQVFSKEKQDLQRRLPPLKSRLASDGMLWVSWPKMASKAKTDLTENVVREVGLKNGLVDVKVCAVDDIWSGLKFVIPLKDRR